MMLDDFCMLDLLNSIQTRTTSASHLLFAMVRDVLLLTTNRKPNLWAFNQYSHANNTSSPSPSYALRFNFHDTITILSHFLYWLQQTHLFYCWPLFIRTVPTIRSVQISVPDLSLGLMIWISFHSLLEGNVIFDACISLSIIICSCPLRLYDTFAIFCVHSLRYTHLLMICYYY